MEKGLFNLEDSLNKIMKSYMYIFMIIELS